MGLVSQPKKELTELGFTNGIVVIGKTVLEVVAPLAPGKRPHVEAFIKERGGPGLYKLVFQTFDAAALLYVAAYLPEIKTSGLVEAAIEATGFVGASVVP